MNPTRRADEDCQKSALANKKKKRKKSTYGVLSSKSETEGWWCGKWHYCCIGPKRGEERSDCSVQVQA